MSEDIIRLVPKKQGARGWTPMECLDTVISENTQDGREMVKVIVLVAGLHKDEPYSRLYAAGHTEASLIFYLLSGIHSRLHVLEAE